MLKTQPSHLAAHRRQVALVRQSLLVGAQQREQVAQHVSRLSRLAG